MFLTQPVCIVQKQNTMKLLPQADKRRCTNDVCTEGEGQPKSDQRLPGCVNLVLTRGEGVQNPENLADVICEWPLCSVAVCGGAADGVYISIVASSGGGGTRVVAQSRMELITSAWMRDRETEREDERNRLRQSTHDATGREGEG